MMATGKYSNEMNESTVHKPSHKRTKIITQAVPLLRPNRQAERPEDYSEMSESPSRGTKSIGQDSKA